MIMKFAKNKLAENDNNFVSIIAQTMKCLQLAD